MFQDGYTTDNNSDHLRRQRPDHLLPVRRRTTTTAGSSSAPTTTTDRISVRFNGSHRVFDNLKVGRQRRLHRRRRRLRGQPQQHRRPAARRLALAARLQQPAVPRPGLRAPPLLPVPQPGPGLQSSSRVYDNPFFVGQRERRHVATSAGPSAASTPSSRHSAGSRSTTRWASTTPTTSGPRAGPGRPRTPRWSGANGVGGVNAGYIRTFQIDHNLTATARYKMSPAWSGTVTRGPEPQLQQLPDPADAGHRLIAPAAVQPGEHRRPSSRPTTSGRRSGSSRTSRRRRRTSGTSSS